MEAAPRLIDISEKRAARRDAAPLTSDLLARKGEAVSAAREVLNAHATTTLPPAERQVLDAPRAGFLPPKQWVVAAAIVLIGGSVAIGYLSRPAIEQTTVEVKVPVSNAETAAVPPVRADNAPKEARLDIVSGPDRKETLAAAETPARAAETVAVPKSADVPVVNAVEGSTVEVSVAAPVPARALPATPTLRPVAASNVSAPPGKSSKAPEATVPAPPTAIAKPVPPPPVEKTVPLRPKPAAVKPPSPPKLAVAALTPPTAAVAPQAAQARPYMIQLVSVKSESAATREWERLQKRFAGFFGALDPSVQKVALKKRGTFYRLRADGFETRRQASAACRQLKAAGQGCLVVKR